jgi:membrane associated rhomboid family serine protease
MDLGPASVAVIAIIATVAGLLISRRFNGVVVIAIGLIASFIASLSLTNGDPMVVWLELGYRTADLSDISTLYTLITSSFLHQDAMHLIANLIFLVLIGYPLSVRIGGPAFVLFTAVGDMVGMTLYAAFNSPGDVIVIGSSVFISTIVGVMLVMYPNIEIEFPEPVGKLKIEVWTVCLVWLALQCLQSMHLLSGMMDVAYMSHLYGFLAGVVIGAGLRTFGNGILRKHEIPVDENAVFDVCETDEQKECYAKAKACTDPEIRSAWLHYIIVGCRCPICGSRFRVVRRDIVCDNGHTADEAMERTARCTFMPSADERGQ